MKYHEYFASWKSRYGESSALCYVPLCCMSDLRHHGILQFKTHSSMAFIVGNSNLCKFSKRRIDESSFKASSDLAEYSFLSDDNFKHVQIAQFEITCKSFCSSAFLY